MKMLMMWCLLCGALVAQEVEKNVDTAGTCEQREEEEEKAEPLTLEQRVERLEKEVAKRKVVVRIFGVPTNVERLTERYYWRTWKRQRDVDWLLREKGVHPHDIERLVDEEQKERLNAALNERQLHDQQKALLDTQHRIQSRIRSLPR